MKKAVITGLFLMMGLLLCTGTVFGESFKTVKVTNEFVNIRELGSTDSKLLGKALKDQKLTVVDEANGWYAIHTGTSSIGYVKAEYCAQTADYIIGHTGSDGANLREKASTDSAVLVKLPAGISVQVHNKNNEWYQISAQGKSGYVRSDVLDLGFKIQAAVQPPVVKKVAQAAAAPKVVAQSGHLRVNRGESVSALMDYAKSQLGKPYVWGRSGPDAFDCSGFTMYCYRQSLGISLPHSSGSMSQIGETVPTSEMLPGDLVFFDTDHSGNVCHVGIYVGNGNFIHASDAKKHHCSVVISTLETGFYNDCFKWAKRINMN